MACYLDLFEYDNELDTLLETLDVDCRLGIALSCVKRVVHLSKPYDPQEIVPRYVNGFNAYMKAILEKRKIIELEISKIEHVANQHYEAIYDEKYSGLHSDQIPNSIENQLNKASQARYAAASARHVYLSQIWNVAEEAHTCYPSAISLAWAATLGAVSYTHLTLPTKRIV